MQVFQLVTHYKTADDEVIVTEMSHLYATLSQALRVRTKAEELWNGAGFASARAARGTDRIAVSVMPVMVHGTDRAIPDKRNPLTMTVQRIDRVYRRGRNIFRVEHGTDYYVNRNVVRETVAQRNAFLASDAAAAIRERWGATKITEKAVWDKVVLSNERGS